MTNSYNIFNIQHFISHYKKIITGSKYIIEFSPWVSINTNSKISKLINAFKNKLYFADLRHIQNGMSFKINATNEMEIIQMSCNSIKLPNIQTDGTNINTGGIQFNLLSSFKINGNISLTIYNSGPQLEFFNELSNIMYDQQSKLFSYPEDYLLNMDVYDYAITSPSHLNNWVTHYKLKMCYLISFDMPDLAYNNKDIQTFTSQFHVNSCEIKINNK